MDSYQNQCIFSDWPDVEPGDDLESDMFYDENLGITLNFALIKNDQPDLPPFTLRLDLFSKDSPFIIGLIVCIKTSFNKINRQIYSYNYYKFTRKVTSSPISLNFPKVSNITKKGWQDNELQMFFIIKHWPTNSLPYALRMPAITRSTHFATLLTEYSTCYLSSVISILYNIPKFRDLIFRVPELKYSISNKSFSKGLDNSLITDLANEGSQKEINTNPLTRTLSHPIESSLTKQKEKKRKGIKCVRHNSMSVGSDLYNGSHKNAVLPILQALQRLFAMMNNPCVCPTRVLTNSFGWPKIALKVQHDAQEFLCNFLDKLKERLPTSFEKEYIDLFYGTERNYKIIKNEDGTQDTQVTEQQFNILQIKNIKKFNNLESGLNYYFQDDNVNENLTLRTRLARLPKILSFHICRFNGMAKDSSVFFYPKYIDMSDYVVNKDDKKPSPIDNLYKLFALVVHSGNGNHGHYFSYVNPTVFDKWIKYDGQKAYLVENEASIFRQNYGTSDKSKGSTCPTAYILMYIRVDCMEEVMGIDRPVKPSYEAEDFANKALRKEKNEKNIQKNDQNPNITISLLNETNLRDSINSGSSINFEKVKPWKALTINQETTQKDLYSIVKKTLKSDLNIDSEFRLWKCDIKKIPKYYIVCDEKSTIGTLSKCDFCIYVEIVNSSFPLLNEAIDFYSDTIIVFFAFFDPLQLVKDHINLKRFKYICNFPVFKKNSISTATDVLIGKINELKLNVNYTDEDIKLHFFINENNDDSFCEVRSSCTFEEKRIVNGSFIYVQIFTNQREPDFSLPSVVPNYLNSLDHLSPSNIKWNESEGEAVSLFQTMNFEFPLSLTNIFSMFYDSLLFNVFGFGYMNSNRYYTIRVPAQMKCVDFKRYLARVLGDEFVTIFTDEEKRQNGIDIVQIFPAPRINCPLTTSLPIEPSLTTEIKKLFSEGKEENKNNYLEEEENDDEDDDNKNIELVDDIYVQIDHHVLVGGFFKRVSFSVDGINPTFCFQAFIPRNNYTVGELFDNIIAPKISKLAKNPENDNSDFEIIRRMIENQDSPNKEVLIYDPSSIRTVKIQNSIIFNYDMNLKTKISKTEPTTHEIRFEIIPEEQKGKKALIPVSLGASLATTVVIGVGNPFMLLIEGSEDEIKERLDNNLKKVLSNDEFNYKERIISFKFGKSSGDVIENSKLLANSNSNDSFFVASGSIELKSQSQYFDDNEKETIGLIKEAQKQNYILFVTIDGLKASNFFCAGEYFLDLKILN